MIVPQNEKPGLSSREHAKQRRAMGRKSALEGYLFLLPWMIGVLIFTAYPIGYSMFLSFNRIQISTSGSGLDYIYVGWDNFKYAFLRDNVFPEQMFIFWRESLIMIPITVLFALLVSILLDQKFRGRMFFRAIFFLPVIFATGRVLGELFTQGQGDMPFIEQYNLTDMAYRLLPESIAGPVVSVLSKIVFVLWYSGVQILIFLGAFRTVSAQTYEAAQIDGATPWESFWKITFPSIVPFIFLNLIYTIVDMSTYIYNPIIYHILSNMNNPKTGYGYASAIGWIYFIVVLVLIAILAKFSASLGKRKEVGR